VSYWYDFDNSMTEEERLKVIRARNPQMSDAEAEEYRFAMWTRHDQKKQLTDYRGMSNQMAERFLDKAGYPRPFGWSSVFYYPGSRKFRTRYKVLLVVAVAAIVWNYW
jgi:hypothetical protein